jgi:asparagine synthase (glutamine-hydrolysing)
MCGICGGIGPSSPKRELLESQLRSIEHRGPDDRGTYLGPNIGLGMCRLAIVEIDNGKQPASDAREIIHLVFNGEIYNYRELIEELASQGIQCARRSESEVIIQLYLRYGLEFISKLNGMFAIALFDSRNQSLHLIRDRMGKKPLWYTVKADSSLIFASEVRALMLARPDRTLRPEMISEVMQYGYINAPQSAFNEISQVPPATVMSWVDGKITSSKYWQPTFEPKVKISYQDALVETKSRIEKAVARRLISERPLGAFLSGGYDSTIVTAYMSKLMSVKVDTFSIGFTNQAFNEAPFAREVAKYLGTNHHEEILTPDPALIIEKISSILDQPFADSSIIPTYLLSKFARENVIVALGGDGGDEVFGGYDRYLGAPLLQAANPMMPLAKSLLGLLKSDALGSSRKVKRASTQLQRKSSLAHRYSSIQSLVQTETLNHLINPEFLNFSHNNRFINHFNNSGDFANYDKMIRSDLDYYLPGDLMVKADIASMANSLELRSPLLDVNVVEWGLQLPRKYKIKGFETKHILKDVARSLVPAQLIDRPKMGFGIPRAEWLRTGLKEMTIDLLTDQQAMQRGWFNSDEVKRVLNTHMSGEDRDSTLWPMLMLELWARNWLD